MTLEIPAEAERMKLLLPYAEYRRWWLEHVIQRTSKRLPETEE